MSAIEVDKRTLDRSFENTYGFLKPEQFPVIDWANIDHIQLLFPEYYRNLLEVRKKNGRTEKSIRVDSFDMNVPLSTDYLFKGAKLAIEPKKRCALYGINGSGKSTLFQAIAAKEIEGIPTYLHVHHMKELEHNEAADAVSVMDTVLCSHPLRRVLVCMEEHLKTLIAAEERDESKSDRLELLNQSLAYVQEEMNGCAGYTGEKRARQMLRVLGFDEVGELAPVSSLSGGLRMRVALACAFFIEPDLLLLDEPTNHLDLPSVLWLENKLRGYNGSWVLVTHDRILLENVVTSVILIQDNLLNYYDCGFVEFEKEKEIADEERDKRIERFLQLNRNPDPATPLFRTYLQYRDWREKRHARQVLLAGKFTFKAPEPLSGGSDEKQDDISLIKVENVRFSYDPAKGLPFIFDTPISYNVTMSTRVGIMGPNGAGKSTFLKLITGKLTATEGSISTHPTYSLAYFGQHSTKELKLDMSPLEFMQWSFPGANIGELKSHLEKSSISGHTMNAAMSNLSFSQRSCVIFAKLTYVPPHLLIMDEPTNFLDLDSVDSLIGAVNKFKGAVIIVTHNRDFLKKCCRDFLSIIPGAFLEFKTMKEAERATYSFITALEEGKPVDFKRAIMENRGGGAVHTEEELAERAKRLELQQLLAQKKEEEKKAEEERLAKIAAEKEAKRLAREAQKKTDWAADEACFFPVNGKWTPAIVVRNVPRMGVTIKFASGKTMMVEATKLRSEIPEGGAATGPEKKEAPASGGRGGKTGGRGGSAAGSKPRGGAAAGGRGGKPRGGAAPRGGRK